MEKEPTLEEKLDSMWTQHIMACLAIINAWSETDGQQDWTSPEPGVL